MIGEPKNVYFHEFRIFGRVHPPRNQLFLSLETPRHLNKIKKKPYAFSKHIVFIKLGILEFQKFDNFRKGGHRIMMKIRLTTSWESWIWDQYLPENKKWQFDKFLKP